jgi:hypothetical protein
VTGVPSLTRRLHHQPIPAGVSQHPVASWADGCNLSPPGLAQFRVTGAEREREGAGRRQNTQSTGIASPTAGRRVRRLWHPKSATQFATQMVASSYRRRGIRCNRRPVFRYKTAFVAVCCQPAPTLGPSLHREGRRFESCIAHQLFRHDDGPMRGRFW